MRRREFITLLGGTALAWPPTAGASQPVPPVVGFLRSTGLADSMDFVTAFRQGLAEADYVEGQNVAIEYRYAENNAGRLLGLVADLFAGRSL